MSRAIVNPRDPEGYSSDELATIRESFGRAYGGNTAPIFIAWERDQHHKLVFTHVMARLAVSSMLKFLTPDGVEVTDTERPILGIRYFPPGTGASIPRSPEAS
eukprot:PhM_4_TR409/c1_g1_i6/m.76005